MTRQEVLDRAAKCVGGDRDVNYGKVEDNFCTIAGFWNNYLSGKFTRDDYVIRSEDVAAMMALVKIARISSGVQKDDNWVDLAGYAACGGELQGPEPKKPKCKCDGCAYDIGVGYNGDGVRIHECSQKECVKERPAT